LQKQVDDFMNEEITKEDDYADWIRWVADAEHSMRVERTPKNTVTLTDTALVPTLQQVIQTQE
jgi:hypothetical protein